MQAGGLKAGGAEDNGVADLESEAHVNRFARREHGAVGQGVQPRARQFRGGFEEFVLLGFHPGASGACFLVGGLRRKLAADGVEQPGALHERERRLAPVLLGQEPGRLPRELAYLRQLLARRSRKLCRRKQVHERRQRRRQVGHARRRAHSRGEHPLDAQEVEPQDANPTQIQLVHPLAAVAAKSLPAELLVGLAGNGRRLVHRHREGLALLRVVAAQQKVTRLPGREAVGKLLGVGLGVAGERNAAAGEDAGGLVMRAGGGLVRPVRDDGDGAQQADLPHQLADDLVLVPDAESFFHRLRVAEVHRAEEAHLSAVASGGLLKLAGAHPGHLVGELRPVLVLPALAAGHRQDDDAAVEAAGEVGEDGGAFVVGVGGDVDDGAPVRQARQAFFERRLGGARRQRARERGEEQKRQ